MLKRVFCIYFGLLIACLQAGTVHATTINAVSDGNWAATGTWSLGRKPTCGDTVVIASGKTVTVNAQENLVPCGAPLIVFVGGIFQFTNGNKIDFPCGSWVYIQAGGIVRKSTAGGGNSTLITICNYIEWKAGDGDLLGIDTLGGHVSLPVTWLTLQASLKNKKADINWSTGVEINNDYFDILRSDNGLNFETIGRVKGSGNSTNVNYYSFQDSDPLPGVSYYRLLQVDFDGTQNPSAIVAVINTSGGFDLSEVHVSPNPVTTEAVISFYSKQEGMVTLEIKNAAGQICLSSRMAAQKGLNSFSIDRVEKLSKGYYTAVVSTGEESFRPLGLIKK